MAKVLETTGMVCPFPLVEAKEAIVDMAMGEELIINFDCTQATESIPRWAATEGHEITEFEQIDDAKWRIIVKRKLINKKTCGNSFARFLFFKTESLARAVSSDNMIERTFKEMWIIWWMRSF